MTEPLESIGTRKAPGFAERNRFGRIGRIPTPTPFPVGDINVYAILPVAGGDRVTLIDTGVKSPEAFEALRHGLKAFGFALEQVERILVTHAHMDHYGQAARIRELSGARVFAPSVEAERMRGGASPTAARTASVQAFFRRWGVPDEVARDDGGMAELARRLCEPIDVDGTLEDGDTVRVGDVALHVLSTPGHCEGHVVFWEEDLRVLFSGDHLLTDISPVPLLALPSDPDAPRPKSLVRFMRSLERVEALPCELVLPAHGDAIRDHRDLIAGYRLHHERRKLQMLRELQRGPRTPFDLAKRLFPRHYRTQVYLVMSEVIGHLDLLLDEGHAVVETRDGVECACARRAAAP